MTESSSPLLAFDLRRDALLRTGVEDEFDIEDYIAQQDSATQLAIAQQGAWVADTFYSNETTLATLRLRAGLSQTQFANACGLKQPHVSRYESGLHEPGLFQAQTMASVLGVSLEQFAQAVLQASVKAKNEVD